MLPVLIDSVLYLLLFIFGRTDLELGSEDGGATNSGHATHPVRKRIAIKLRQGGKGQGPGGSSGRKAKTKTMKDNVNIGDQTGRENEDDIHFGKSVLLF